MINVYEHEKVSCLEGVLNDTGQSVYTFMVDGMLIDTGAEKLQEELIPYFTNESFDFVALTHSHEDHTGNASWIQEHLKLPLYIHPDSVGFCAEPGIYPLYRQKTWGQRRPFAALPIGDTIRSRTLEWQVIYTPGHADDHVSLYHPDTGRLFSGDLFVSPKTKVSMETESIPLIMNSLRTLLALDFNALYCSHTGYFANGREKLQQKLSYLEALCKKVALLNQQGHPASEIKQKLFPAPYPIIQFSDGEWDSLHVVNSILAELKLQNS